MPESHQHNLPPSGADDARTKNPSESATPSGSIRSAPELRAKIVAALNLTPLVPPQADTETLNVVEGAWAALSELMRSVEQLATVTRQRDDLERRLADFKAGRL